MVLLHAAAAPTLASKCFRAGCAIRAILDCLRAACISVRILAQGLRFFIPLTESLTSGGPLIAGAYRDTRESDPRNEYQVAHEFSLDDHCVIA